MTGTFQIVITLRRKLATGSIVFWQGRTTCHLVRDMRGLTRKFSKCRRALLVAALVFSYLTICSARVLYCTVRASFGSNVLQPKTDDVRLLSPNERINE